MPETVARGPVRGAERALAPDLARGVMLLLIVVSNTGFHLFASAFGPDGHPVGGSVADRVVRFAVILTLARPGRASPAPAELPAVLSGRAATRWG
ncbi:hypothetical protein KZZ52_25470 [Dactylosporangium sp. AC04546]|uniref:hypothetical protein n=1 Tax=Dactylosporangium sp. AC04546 TaxID=2862460 RepID=UPI001EE14602|nr:hypothetical protein [Dactylosporangium sp. AC04546]WVK88621.1 hypothetical protein KZZ52_25470 [Dactylosporangium sp. AC04546]